MSALLLLVIALAGGWSLRRAGLASDDAVTGLNRYVIYLALPAVILVSVPRLDPRPELWVAASMAWLHFALAWPVFGWLGRRFGWSAELVGVLRLTGGMGNTSFVGLPMIEALWGVEYLALGVVADQLGSFLVLSTLGLITAARYGGQSTHWRTIARRILLFPPFMALVLALLWPWPWPPLLETTLARLGDSLAPVALCAVGMQLSGVGRGEGGPLAAGLAFKLVLAPALLWAFYLGLGQSGAMVQITVFEAAMPPMIAAAILAREFGVAPRFAGLMVSAGVVVSLLTLPLWRWLLGVAG